MTHAYLGLAAFDLLAVAVGYALLHGLGFVRARGAALRYLGLAFVGGWTVLGLVLALGVTVGIDPSLRNVLLLALAAAVVGVAARRLFAPFERPPRPAETVPLRRAAALAGVALIVVALLGTVLYTVRSEADGSWDLFAFWLPKAEALYYFHGLDTGLSSWLTFTHVEYPPLYPAITAAVFHFMGGVHPSLLPLQQALLGVGFVGSVIALLLPRVPRWILFPLLATLALAPDFWYRASGVLPDQTLAYMLALAAVACILWLDEGRGAWLVLATVFLAAAALTKAEGLFLGGLLAAVVVLASLAARHRRGLPAFALVLGPAAIEPWHLWLRAHHQGTSSYDYDWHDLFRPSVLADRTGRFWYALHKMIGLVFDRQYWSLVTPLAVVVLVVVAGTLRAVSAALAAWLVVGFLGLGAVYWIGKPDVVWYVATSAHRVVDTLPLVAGSVLPLLLGLALERRSASGGGV